MGWVESAFGAYNNLISGFPIKIQLFINLFLLTIIVVIYAIFIWRLYIFISTKDIIRLNLNRYNSAKHPFLVKFNATVLYILEYIIILPILIIFWFAFFTILLTLLSKGIETTTIALIAAITIAAIRVISYIPKYGEAAAGETAKVVPFTLLAISLTDPTFFHFNEIANQFLKIPEAINEISIYIFFIFALEIFLRILSFGGLAFRRSNRENSAKKENT